MLSTCGASGTTATVTGALKCSACTAAIEPFAAIPTRGARAGGTRAASAIAMQTAKSRRASSMAGSQQIGRALDRNRHYDHTAGDPEHDVAVELKERRDGAAGVTVRKRCALHRRRVTEPVKPASRHDESRG